MYQPQKNFRISSSRLFVASFLMLASMCMPCQAWADPAVRSLAEHCLKCTVGISCRLGELQSYFGTGAVITPDGHIITSTTVVPPGATDIVVMFPGFEMRPGVLTEANEALEATVIKVEATDIPFLPIMRDLPQIGEPAYSMSNANNVLQLTGTATFSRGIISGRYPVENSGGESLYAGLAIETTAAVNPGSDGGPIVNDAGQICAIISLNVPPARWQVVGGPTKILLEQFSVLRSGQLRLSFDPLPGRSATTTAPPPLVQHANAIAGFMASINVQRKHPPETLPRVPWESFRSMIVDWDGKPKIEQGALLQGYFELSRLMEVNQMLRRPATPSTGLVISSDGFILTSAFNVSEDLVFLEAKTGKLREFKFTANPEDMLKEPEGGYSREMNEVEKILVTLPDGSQHEARLVAQHLPMGIALLKIEKTDLAFLDLAQSMSAPQLGAETAILGIVGGTPSQFTINTGIVSAELRSRGFQAQTDALVNYGNSGGPVINDQGRLLGIASTPIEPRTIQGRIVTSPELVTWTIAPNSGVSMIARADRIAASLDTLKAGTSTINIPGAFMGIGPDTNRIFGKDVVVGSVAPNSPASNANIQPGDQLLSINKEPLESWKDMIELLQHYQPGDVIQVEVRRDAIVKQLQINGRTVATEGDLKELMKLLKPGEKFEGTFVQENTKTVTVTLGERK